MAAMVPSRLLWSWEVFVVDTPMREPAVQCGEQVLGGGAESIQQILVCVSDKFERPCAYPTVWLIFYCTSSVSHEQ